LKETEPLTHLLAQNRFTYLTIMF